VTELRRVEPRDTPMDENQSLIVLVEDNEPTRRTMERILVRAGWRVMSAATVAEGLAFLDWEPQCVVLDLLLPDARGEAVLRRVRESHPQTRVIVTTGLDDDAQLEALRKLKPEVVLKKPIEMNEFLAVCQPFGSAFAPRDRNA
jgi:DNA-binding response OmpR family regulator